MDDSILHRLRERVKELACLYGISQIINWDAHFLHRYRQPLEHDIDIDILSRHVLGQMSAMMVEFQFGIGEACLPGRLQPQPRQFGLVGVVINAEPCSGTLRQLNSRSRGMLKPLQLLPDSQPAWSAAQQEHKRSNLRSQKPGKKRH